MIFNIFGLAAVVILHERNKENYRSRYLAGFLHGFLWFLGFLIVSFAIPYFSYYSEPQHSTPDGVELVDDDGWRYVSEESNGDRYFIMKDGFSTYWVKHESVTDSSTYTTRRYEIDCHDAELGLIQTVRHKSTGEVISKTKAKDATTVSIMHMEPAPPGTIESKILKAACK